MSYKTVKGFSGAAQLGILFIFLGLGFILAGLSQFVIGMQMVPANTATTDLPTAMLKAMTNPANVNTVRFLQVSSTFFLMFLPALLCSWVTNGFKRFWLGFNPYLHIKQVGLGFLLIYAANIFAGPMAELSKEIVAGMPSVKAMADGMEKTYNEQVLLLSNLNGWGDYLLSIIIIAFFPAVFEEVFFRGALQNNLTKWWGKPILAITVSALLFSFIHLSIYLFISRFVLGFVLGLLFYHSKNIWVNIIAHFLNNAIVLTQIFYMSKQNQKIKLDDLDPAIPWWAAAIALAALTGGFIIFKKISAENRVKILHKENLLSAQADPFKNIAENLN